MLVCIIALLCLISDDKQLTTGLYIFVSKVTIGLFKFFEFCRACWTKYFFVTFVFLAPVICNFYLFTLMIVSRMIDQNVG